MTKLLDFYLLVKEDKSLWEQFLEEVQDVVDMFADFFVMIKEITYDPMVEKIGYNATNILLIMLAALLLMLILTKVISR